MRPLVKGILYQEPSFSRTEVLDVTRAIAGPSVSKVLALLGTDVLYHREKSRKRR